MLKLACLQVDSRGSHIQCTRCVRFASEIAGVDDLGLLNRGEDVEIGTYISKAVETELSGNLADVCPVGALLNKPYSFTARPWELRKVESIDVMDAVGSNIRIDVRGNEVMRVLPRLNEAINEEWIADKTRYACDGLKFQRLDRPYVRDTAGKLRECSWEEAFIYTAGALKGMHGAQIAALAGDLADVESVYALRDLMRSLGSNMMDCRVDGAGLDVSTPTAYRFNTTIAGLEQADAIILVGCNPRTEAPMINARIRKAWLNKRTPVYVIGERLDLNYPYTHLGTGPDALASLNIQAEKPALIVGMSALRNADASAILALARSKAVVNDGWNGFNVLHTAAGRVGALMVGFTPPKGQFSTNGVKAFYLLGVDSEDVNNHVIPKDAFIIYQGHHGDAGAQRANVIFPGVAYPEKNALYVNTEGRVQMAYQATTPLGQAKEDWKILRALSEVIGNPLPYNTQSELRARLGKEFPAFTKIGEIAPATWGDFGKTGDIKVKTFAPAIDNYYQTDPISRASVTMAECVEEFTRKIPLAAQ